MKKTSFIQKLLLIFFGIFLSLIFLEAGLRIAGCVVLYLQERHNHLTFKQNEYRVLCLGESTTALGGEDSYPSQLEQMLNIKTAGRRFTVINKGVISTNTNYILSHADQNMDMYKPQMVIVMMGINDRVYLHDFYKSLWWENIKSYLKGLRVYKLADLLYERVTHRIKEINAPAEKVDLSHVDDDNYQQVENFLKTVLAKCMESFARHMSASAHYKQDLQFSQAQQEIQFARKSLFEASSTCVELARRYRLQGLLPQAQKFLEQATIFNPHQPDVFQEWGEFYLAQKKSLEAAQAFQSALALAPENGADILGLAHAYYQEHSDSAFFVYDGYLQTNPQDYWGYIELAQWLRESNHLTQAQGYLNRAIKIMPNFDQAYLDLGQMLDDQREYQKEKAFYLNEISTYPQNPRFYRALGQFYQKQGNGDLAKEYLQKAAGFEVAGYRPVTLVNYNLLLDKILSRHIKVIVMQYPLRDISPLKNYLGQRNGVIFVENKQNFKQALSKEGYNHYFKDNFAYDFGHCTRAGNELIAYNLAGIILNNE